MRTRRLIGFLALMLLVAACAGSETTSGTTSAPAIDQDQTDTASGPDQDTAASPQVEDNADDLAPGQREETVEAAIVRTDDDETVNDSFVSPVFEALGFDPNDRQEARNQFVSAAEELVRQCMADTGFDYLPTVPGFAPSLERQLELNETISPDQFIDEYGFGISTLLELDFREDGVLAFVELLLGPPAAEARSEGEQTAYEMALSGNTIQGLTAEDAQEQAFNNFGGEEGSCRFFGYSTADNSVGEKFEGLFTLLGDEYDAIFEQVENDPRIRSQNGEWQTCMASGGYSYENPQEIVDELLEESDALRNGFQRSPEALTIFAAAASANLATMNADDRFDFLEENGAFQGFSLVPSLQAELDDLIQFELTVARRDADCGDEDLRLAVQLEYEQDFVEQHAEQLELIASGQAA